MSDRSPARTPSAVRPPACYDPAAQQLHAQDQAGRRDDLVRLLEEHRDWRCLTSSSGVEAGYRGDGLVLFSHSPACRFLRGSRRCTCHHASFAELERALTSLKAAAPVHHTHLAERYLRSERVQRRVWFRHGRWQVEPHERVVYPDLDRGRTPPTKEYACMVVRWRPWVDLLIVAQALDMLDALYEGAIVLPVAA